MLHPDERFLVDMVFRVGWPSSVGQWFDSARSPFNPANAGDAFYVYGQWPLLLGKGAASAVGATDAAGVHGDWPRVVGAVRCGHGRADLLDRAPHCGDKMGVMRGGVGGVGGASRSAEPFFHG